MADHPDFTTIVPVYNRAGLVAQTLDAVLAQQGVTQEVIVVDDGSTDDTPRVLERYADRVRILRQDNAGPGPARNRAITEAAGRYIAFCDSDDLWLDWTLATYKDVIEQCGHPTLIASPVLAFGSVEQVQAIERKDLRFSQYDDYFASARDARWIVPCGACVCADTLRKIKGFVDKRMNFEDSDLWLRLGTGQGFVRIEAPICAARRKHDSNVTADLTRTIEGIDHIIEQEETERYPGGTQRRRQRLTLLTRHVRPVSLECIRRGRRDAAWRFYRASFGWHLRLGRLRYLLGFPVYAMMHRGKNA